MKLLILALSLVAIICSCSNEKKTHQQETVFKYETGELMLKKVIDLDDSNPTDSIISITCEYFDKSGKVFLKTYQEKSEDAPYKIESELFSSITNFKDAQERSFIDKIYNELKTKQPDAVASIKYQPEWMKFESTMGFTATFPALPEENEKDVNENIKYYEATYKNDDLGYMVRIFHDKTVSDEKGLNELFNKLSTPEPNMKILEEKEMDILGNKGFFKKIDADYGETHVYSQVVQFSYKMHVISLAVIGKKDFADYSEFTKFVEGFLLTQ